MPAEDSDVAPNVLTGGPDGKTFTARRATHATGFQPNAFARARSHATTVQPRNRLKTNRWRMEPTTGLPLRARYHPMNVGARYISQKTSPRSTTAHLRFFLLRGKDVVAGESSGFCVYWLEPT
jgi:hypothetical protein